MGSVILGRGTLGIKQAQQAAQNSTSDACTLVYPIRCAFTIGPLLQHSHLAVSGQQSCCWLASYINVASKEYFSTSEQFDEHTTISLSFFFFSLSLSRLLYEELVACSA
eukprot:6438266-Pyramimonas_sp.AAC.1